MKKSFLGIVVLVTAALAAGCREAAESGAATATKDVGAWTVERRREWASRLAADGLDDQALAVYEEILAHGEGLTDKLVAGLSIRVADLHMKAHRYEQALASLYRAKVVDLSEALARSVDEKRILCLERIGRSGLADNLLDKVSGLDRSASVGAGGDDVLAEIGEEKITRADLEALIAASPPEMQARFSRPDAKKEILKSLVAQRVMVKKARRLELDKDPKVRLAMDAASREILVKKLMADEVRDKVTVEPADAKLYYEAHADVFRVPGELALSGILVADEAAEAEVRAALKNGDDFTATARTRSKDEATRDAGGKIEARLVEGRYHETFVNVADVFAAVGATPAGRVADKAVVTASGRWIVRVDERVDGRQKPFDEVAEEAMLRLRAEREQAAVKRMIDEAVTSTDVKIFEDRLK